MAPGPWQLLIILFILIVLFGGARIAMAGKGLGEGIRNFRRGLKGSDKEPDALGSDSAPDDR